MNKIIVLDDDHTNVSLIKMILELDGFSVTACTEIEQAETAAANGVDALLIDCNLARGISGLDLVRDIRAGRSNAPKDVVIIVTSGDHRLSEASYAAGADHFLLKPYPPNELSEKLTKLIAKRKTHGE
ncbi:MAG: response regulator [Chloroflexi bacterium]|nr:MAG: response regulator [Chloroflexota bacterium]